MQPTLALVTPPVDDMAGRLRVSEEFMAADLDKSGLTPEDIGAYAHAYPKSERTKIRLKNGQLVDFVIGEAVIAAYRFPYYMRDGSPITGPFSIPLMYRERRAYAEWVDPAIRKRKYNQPSRRKVGDLATIPYFHPNRLKNRGSGGQYDIHEGEKKHACGVKHALQDGCAIAGSDNWRDPNNKTKIHPEILADIEDAKAATSGAFIVRLNPDGDIHSYNVQRGWGEFAFRLRDLGYTIVIMDLSVISPHAKFDDLVAEHGAAWVMEHAGTLSLDLLTRSHPILLTQFHRLRGTGDPPYILPNISNILTLLREHPAFAKRIWRNEDTLDVMFDSEPVTQGTFETEILEYFERFLSFNSRANQRQLAKSVIKDAIGLVAQENARSQYAEHLLSLKWDGVERLDNWGQRLCNFEDTSFAREACKRFVISLVGRTLNPGCPCRWVLVIRGEQNIGKSGLPEIFVGPESVVLLGSQEGKDITLAMHSGKIVNHDELEHLDRRGLKALKQDISTKVDSVRIPYEPASKQRPRRFVQYGSVNETEFLANDPSGNNRWVVVEALGKRGERFDFPNLYAESSQLLAEAVVRYEEGYPFDTVPGADLIAAKYEKENKWTAEILELYANGSLDKVAPKVSPAVAARAGFAGLLIVKGKALFQKLGLDPKDRLSEFAVGDALRALGFKKDEHICRPGKSWVIDRRTLNDAL